MKGGEFMTILKAVSKTSMERSMELEAKTSYSACTEDCPKCRVSDEIGRASCRERV